MKASVSAGGAGLLFGLGLGVSGMTLPSKVIDFLDVTGPWDASLAFVMLGALVVHVVLFRVVKRRASPLFDVKFHLPTRRDVDAKLVLGAALFGVGWGLAGYCPGPAVVSAAKGSVPALIFVSAMALGMVAQHRTPSRSHRARELRNRNRHETIDAPLEESVIAEGS